MGRTKKIDYLRTQFRVDVESTVYRLQEDGIDNLKTRTNLAGVYFEATHVEGNTFLIVSRPNGIKNAIKDHLFLVRNFEAQFGRVYEIELLGRPTTGHKKDHYCISYEIAENQLKPVNEWDNYPIYDLEYPTYF